MCLRQAGWPWDSCLKGRLCWSILSGPEQWITVWGHWCQQPLSDLLTSFQRGTGSYRVCLSVCSLDNYLSAHSYLLAEGGVPRDLPSGSVAMENETKYGVPSLVFISRVGERIINVALPSNSDQCLYVLLRVLDFTIYILSILLPWQCLWNPIMMLGIILGSVAYKASTLNLYKFSRSISNSFLLSFQCYNCRVIGFGCWVVGTTLYCSHRVKYLRTHFSMGTREIVAWVRFSPCCSQL